MRNIADFAWEVFGVVCLVLVVVVALGGVLATAYRHLALIDECVADGHKAYVCEAMLKGRR